MSNDDSSRVRKATLPLTSASGRIEVEAARPRRSTLETFNEEMAVMERPLEDDVEYIDEPRPSRWRPIAFAAVVVAVGGGGGALFMSRQHASAAVEARTAETPLAAVAVASPPVLAPEVPAAAPPPAPAEVPVPAEAVAPAAAPEADDATEDDAAASDSAARGAPRPKGAWAKVRSKVGSAKPARATSGKATTLRRTTTTTTQHVVAKRTVTRHR